MLSAYGMCSMRAISNIQREIHNFLIIYILSNTGIISSSAVSIQLETVSSACFAVRSSTFPLLSPTPSPPFGPIILNLAPTLNQSYNQNRIESNRIETSTSPLPLTFNVEKSRRTEVTTTSLYTIRNINLQREQEYSAQIRKYNIRTPSSLLSLMIAVLKQEQD